MPASFTIPQLLELAKVPSTADNLAVMEAMRPITSALLWWDGPMDNATYITNLVIGDLPEPGKVVISFSCFGNLAFIYPVEGGDPVLEVDVVDKVLNTYGWSVVSDETSRMDVYPEHGICVHDCFFNCM